MKVVIAGGGTAGHVFPAIALADRLRQGHGVEVVFIGSAQGQEATLVPRAGYEFVGIRAAQLTRKLSLSALRAPLVALGSTRDCRQVVRDSDVVVGMGGYVSVPAALAAWRSRVPLVLHEQNAIPGVANKTFAGMARKIGVTFGQTVTELRSSVRSKVVITGNPVRGRILAVTSERERLRDEAMKRFGLDPTRKTVVLFGGSQGALSLDQALVDALKEGSLGGRSDVQFLALTGAAHREAFLRALPQVSVPVGSVGFLEEVELAYAVADLAIGRAGAGHVAELAVCSIASILVPYPYATGDHQSANARELEDAGGAIVMFQNEVTGRTLADRVVSLLDDPSALDRMAASARSWAKPDADERLASLVIEATS